MFNDVWKEAILSGSFYNNEQAVGTLGQRPAGTGTAAGQGWNGGWNNGS